MIKHLGSKRLLAPAIVACVGALPGVRSVIDLFSGTSRVGHALKAAGYRVLANDHNAYAHTLSRCYVEADREDVEADANPLIAGLNRIPGEAGWFTETYCVRSRYFHPANGARIEAIRNAIEGMDLKPDLRSTLLVSLMEAADRVDSTVGVQMAYLKDWAPRAHKPLDMRLPRVLPRAANGRGEAHRMDALEAVERLEADAAYIDPPYNQHSFLGNYHVWETLVLWDRPEVYGVACKRADCRTRRSVFNSRPGALDALRRVVEGVRARHLIVSFSDEGYVSRGEMEALLAARGEVVTIERGFKRYVGAQIGIYNPAGERVGTPGKMRNSEYLFVVSPDAIDAGALERLSDARLGSLLA